MRLALTPMGLRAGGRVIPCSIGRGGISATKREGDGATPMGAHRILGVLYRPDRLARPSPWAQPILDQGRRLAASYANFLIINGAVLMPAYGDSADGKAAAVLAAAFPGREIVPIPCRSLIWQNGSLHCITMQLPAGLLAPAH